MRSIEVASAAAAVASAASLLAVLHLSTKGASIDDVMPVSSPTAPLHAIVVARARDCDSRLGFAHVFERPRTIGIQFEGLAILPDQNDGKMTPLRSLDALELKVLPPLPAYGTMLGQYVRFLPVLVLYDRQRVVRIMIQAPMSVESADLLTTWIVSRAK
jgi:hypothetical protein